MKVADSYFTNLSNSLNSAFTVSDYNNPLQYFQNSIHPFMIIIMSNHPDDSDQNAISVFTPNSQFNSSLPDTNSQIISRKLHQHNYFEFMYILKGHMYQIVEGRRYLYTAGSCSILNRNTMHTEETHTEFVAIFFTLSVEFLERFFYKDSILLFTEERLLTNELVYHFLQENLDIIHCNNKDFLDFVPCITETDQKTLVHDLFEKIINTMISPYYGATFQIQNLFFQLVAILCDTKYYHVKHVTAHSNSVSMILARIDLLLSEYNGRISNHQLAEILNYNGAYLSHIIKKSYGISLFEYSMRFTMRSASYMLIHTKKSVSEIAAELQFTNRTHFYKIFQNFYGTTPGDYRKNNI